MTSNISNSQRIIRRVEVQRLTGLSRSSLYAAIKVGEFPAQINLGLKAVGWVESEVLDWIRGRIAASRAGTGV